MLPDLKQISGNEFKVPTRKISAICFDPKSSKFTYSERICICALCSKGEIESCLKIPSISVNAPGLQENNSDEDDIYEEEIIAGDVSDEEDNYPLSLSEKDRQIALNSTFLIKNDELYSIGQVESIILAYKEICAQGIYLSGPTMFNTLASSPRVQEHKTAVQKLETNKKMFLFIMHWPRSTTDGHYLAISVNIEQRIQFSISKNYYNYKFNISRKNFEIKFLNPF